MLRQPPVGFGFYRMGSLADGLPEVLETEFAKGYLNTYIVSLASHTFEEARTALHKLKEAGAFGWLGIAETVFRFTQPVQVNHGWQEALRGMLDRLAQEDLLDTVAGFYFDEPMLCGIETTVFRDVTKALRENWPELRVFTIFATNAIEPEVWSNNGNDRVLDLDVTQYLTDTGYDMYWDVRGEGFEQGIENYKKVNAALKKRLGREDVRIWYVPCVMSYHGTSDEAYALAHVEAMYEFLKAEKNPGGLLCYAYDIPNGDGELSNIGFAKLRDRAEEPWTALDARLQSLGRELLGNVTQTRTQ